MWILLNNQPVCVFNIKNVSGIITISVKKVCCHTYILMLINYIGKE